MAEQIGVLFPLSMVVLHMFNSNNNGMSLGDPTLEAHYSKNYLAGLKRK